MTVHSPTDHAAAPSPPSIPPPIAPPAAPPARRTPPPSPDTAPTPNGAEQPVAVASVITVKAWVDPLVDDHGHDPRSSYVETFWLGVLGPTATWLLRRLATELERHPNGVDFDLVSTAAAMGMSFRSSRSSAFTKALQRCVMFGLAHQLPDGGLAVRRRVPTVARRHLRRLPEDLQVLHQEWESATISLDGLTRAHGLAMAMLDVGDELCLIEPQLRALGVDMTVAEHVADNVARLVTDRLQATDDEAAVVSDSEPDGDDT